MINFRLYRFGLLFGVAAAVVLMFSVVSRPAGVTSDVAADAFDGEHAAAVTRQIVELAPNREPGSGGDAAAADFVAERFRSIQGGTVSEQRLDADFNGDEVPMRNVSLVLPGLSDRRIVIVAPRDCEEGPCAASSGAATAALLELAAVFDGARHAKTLVFVSTDGSVAGAAGAKLVAGELDDPGTDAAIVISQPGFGQGSPPFVVPWSAGPQSTSIQLIESARAAISAELGGDPLDLRTFSSFLRLAVPSGLGEQAVLIDRGVDAVGISSDGDRPLPAADDDLGSLDAVALGSFGRATLSLVFALDGYEGELEHGPGAYLPLAGKLLPGWALALLAIALLVPVALVCVDGLAAASRANQPVLGALLWTLRGALPFLAVLVLAYLMSLVGLVASPAFPYDPQDHSLDLAAVLALIALVAAFVLSVIAIRPLRPSAVEEASGPAIGLVGCAAVVVIWLIDPYFALLLVPTVHLWLLAALPLRGRALPLALLLGGLVVPLVAIGYLGSALGVGWAVPWQLVLMVTGGQFGLAGALALCALGGCLIAIAELCLRRPQRLPRQRPTAPRLGRHAGPGSLGGPPSTAVPGHKF